MFTVSGAKRIRRNDLHSPRASSPTASDASSPDARALLDASHPLPAASPDLTSYEPKQHADEDDAESLSFPLFRPSTITSAQPNRITLTDAADARFKTQSRPDSYYFATSASPTRRAQLQSVALSGEDVAKQSKTAAQGLRCPWRVRTVTVRRKALLALASSEIDSVRIQEPGSERRRGRKGKKTRIKLRKKAQTRREAGERDARRKEEEAERMKEKEEYLAEKKRRMNRKKQGRKREKARLVKAGDEATNSPNNETQDDY
ncbi:MAG: hypothetical protein M1828_002822 [Chrysothrix sp. TS-e1954]|nr:MAG: hypothetical protein M1828_002822 [Chrysothrix sp. TS-e1954]